MKKPDNAKERNLLKGAIRRIFSRSDLRRQCIERAIVPGYYDPKRKAVKFWVKCAACGKMEAKSNMEADHIEPVVPVDSTLEDMTWTEVVERQWCDVENLQPVCKPCHRRKTGEENKARNAFRKKRKLDLAAKTKI